MFKKMQSWLIKHGLLGKSVHLIVALDAWFIHYLSLTKLNIKRYSRLFIILK